MEVWLGPETLENRILTSTAIKLLIGRPKGVTFKDESQILQITQ